MVSELCPVQGQELVDTLHADHLESKQFMNQVGTSLEGLYEAWLTDNRWDQVKVPASFTIPSLGQALDSEDPTGIDKEKFDAYGINSSHGLYELFDAGLLTVQENALKANISPEEGFISFTPQFHASQKSLFHGERFIIAGESTALEAILGEVILTNIGEGDEESYHALQDARIRCTKVVASIFRSQLAMDQLASPVATEHLVRALQAPEEENPRDIYNPLLHTVLEGLTSIGQVTNFLVQPGIEGAEDMPVLEQSKGLLQAHLPLLFSSFAINADIGPNHMAGFAEGGLVIKTEEGFMFQPEFVKAMRVRQTEFRESTADLTGKQLEIMQKPDVRAVNRGEGCPAGKLVRLTSRMLLDALGAA